MRDLQRLEELSSIAALGLWADDVVLALHRATESPEPDRADSQLLTNAAEILDATRERAEQPLSAPKAASALAAATDTALSVVVTLAREKAGDQQEPTERVRMILSSMADTLRGAAIGELGEGAPEQLAVVSDFFGNVSEIQLAESNSVLASRKDRGAWMATQAISSSL
jgi:hypothetical protein